MKKPINRMKMEFSSLSENESFARLAISAFAVQLDPVISDMEDIKTAVSEAVTNAIVHGYEGEEGIVKIEAILFEDGIEITIEDFGRGIHNIEMARRPMFTTKPEEERSGLGFTVMEAFMDNLEVFSKPHVGTKIVMYKKLRETSTMLEGCLEA